MDIRLKVLSLLVGILTLVVSFLNVRRRRLSEKLAVFWIILSIFMIFLALRIDLLVKISNSFNIVDPNNFIFFLGLVFLVFISFYFSLKISRLEKGMAILLQENALLKKKIEER